eukprot:TRINITY_DN879_c0_g1_i1.p1 TRINITY_DN879_c0_g1~~TRINITY_DN879_c0_g1_i1.p1  ORF type:complete len:386 (+),score=91.45 TRINITY_DN879_c0_g1_i1:86-1243(+)
MQCVWMSLLSFAAATLMTTMQGCGSGEKTESVSSTDAPSEAISDNSSSIVSNTTACTVTAKGSASLPSLLQAVKGAIPADVKALIPSEIKEGDVVSTELLAIIAQFQQLENLKNQGWVDGACEAHPVQMPAPPGNDSAEALASNGTNSSNGTRRPVSDNSISIVSNTTACTVTAKGSASLPSLLQALKGAIPANVQALIPSEIKEGDVVSSELLAIIAQFQQLENLKNQGWVDGACEAHPLQVPAPPGNGSAEALASNGTNSSNGTRRPVSDNSISIVSNTTACTVTAKGSASLPSLLQALKGAIPANVQALIPSEIKEGDVVSSELLAIIAQFQQLENLKNQGWVDGACEAHPLQVPAPPGNGSAEALASNATNGSNSTRLLMR